MLISLLTSGIVVLPLIRTANTLYCGRSVLQKMPAKCIKDFVLGALSSTIEVVLSIPGEMFQTIKETVNQSDNNAIDQISTLLGQACVNAIAKTYKLVSVIPEALKEIVDANQRDLNKWDAEATAEAADPKTYDLLDDDDDDYVLARENVQIWNVETLGMLDGEVE